MLQEKQKMSNGVNKLIIPIIVVLILAAGIGSYFIFHKMIFPEPPVIQKILKSIISMTSPFGMHGAVSRPFIESDSVSHEEILKRLHEEKALYRHVQDVGVKWIRPGADIYWQTVQPAIEHKKNEIFDWRSIDDIYGRVLLGVNTLGTIDPLLWSWGLNANPAFKLGTWQFASIEEEKSYIKFVKETVERYDGDGYKDMPGLQSPIKYWQIGNEPAMRQIEIMDLNKKLDWEGFGHIVEISYQAIKENDAEAKIALAGLAVGYPILDNPFLRRELDEFYVPLIQNMSGRYIDIFDIHYYGDAQKGSDGWRWQEMRNTSNWMRQILNQNGYQKAEIWFTETAVPSEPFGERFQAINLFKRCVYPLSFGVKKVFWWNMIEGEYPLEVDKPMNHYGLVYDGIGKDDPGYGVKKLSYYTYKKMVEVLEGSDWNNIEIIQESDNVYIYKFTKDGKPIWVAWNDNSASKTITILGITSNQVEITEAVPKYESGKDVIDYSAAFKTETKSVSDGKLTITLSDKPVFIEEK